MPVFDQGYQHWQGRLSGHGWRWWIITRQGVRAVSRSWWTRLAVLAAWTPALGLTAVLIVWGLIEQQSKLVAPFLIFLKHMPPEIQQGPRILRVPVWTMAFDIFFRVEMLFWMILAMIVGPGLVSQDLRFNAMPLYLSRPIRRIDYFAGKLGVIAIYLALVTTGPALGAYLLGVCFSMDATVLRDTARLLLGIVAYGLVVTLSSGMLMLAASSLSRSSLYVGLIWAAIWMVSGAVAATMAIVVHKSWCWLAAYGGNLERVGAAFLGTESANAYFRRLMGGADPDSFVPAQPGWYWSALVLVGLFGVSVWILTSRVKSLDRLR